MTQTPGSQRRTADAIARAVRAGGPVRVSIICLDDDRAHLDETRSFLRGLGVPEANIGADRVRTVGRGAEAGFEGEWSAPSAGLHSGAGASVASPASPAWPGKLCVAYTGQVYPCIFSRWLPLGDVRTSSLRQILEGLRTRAKSSVSSEVFADKLACLDCRMTALVTALESPA